MDIYRLFFRENVMKRFFLNCGVAHAVIAVSLTSVAYAETKIPFWHAQSGLLGDEIQNLANKFNELHPEYKITPVFKGEYDDTLAVGVAAYRAGNAPTLLQIGDVGTATIIESKAYIPLTEFMAQQEVAFDQDSVIPVVRAYYSDTTTKQLLSFPSQSSVPLLYYNKDLFKQAGLDPNKPPKTWQEVYEDAKKLKAAGVKCAITSNWFGWIEIENYSAWHGTSYATKNNGLEGLDAELTLQNPILAEHLKLISKMAKEGLFSHYGRGSEGLSVFDAGTCAMAQMSSASLTTVEHFAKFNFGVAPMPYDANVPTAPQNPIIGGSSIWVLKNQTPEQYKGAALFLAFLAEPENMAYWHQHSGYVPSIKGAYELSKAAGYYEQHPNYEIAIKELNINDPLPFTQGSRLGYLPQIRTIWLEELESVWAGKKTIDQALIDAQKRGNLLLRRFEKLYKSAK